jgi:hypothetical protein
MAPPAPGALRRLSRPEVPTAGRSSQAMRRGGSSPSQRMAVTVLRVRSENRVRAGSASWPKAAMPAAAAVSSPTATFLKTTCPSSSAGMPSTFPALQRRACVRSLPVSLRPSYLPCLPVLLPIVPRRVVIPRMTGFSRATIEQFHAIRADPVGKTGGGLLAEVDLDGFP